MSFKNTTIILVRPQLPENIGMIARAMQNFGLSNLSLVSPKKKWPNSASIKSSKNASSIIKKVKIYNSIEESIKNFEVVIATTNRKRFLEKKVIKSFPYLNKTISNTKKMAILFGPENSGLSNKDLRLVDYIFTINTANKNNSLNLSHAVSIISFQIHEYFINKKKENQNIKNHKNLSNKKDLNIFLNFLTNRLENANFFKPIEKKDTMLDNIYTIFLKASLTKKELNTLWGIIKKLEKKR